VALDTTKALIDLSNKRDNDWQMKWQNNCHLTIRPNFQGYCGQFDRVNGRRRLCLLAVNQTLTWHSSLMNIIQQLKTNKPGNDSEPLEDTAEDIDTLPVSNFCAVITEMNALFFREKIEISLTTRTPQINHRPANSTVRTPQRHNRHSKSSTSFPCKLKT
jgi:hypothetical protein